MAAFVSRLTHSAGKQVFAARLRKVGTKMSHADFVSLKRTWRACRKKDKAALDLFLGRFGQFLFEVSLDFDHVRSL